MVHNSRKKQHQIKYLRNISIHESLENAAGKPALPIFSIESIKGKQQGSVKLL